MHPGRQRAGSKKECASSATSWRSVACPAEFPQSAANTTCSDPATLRSTEWGEGSDGRGTPRARTEPMRRMSDLLTLLPILVMANACFDADSDDDDDDDSDTGDFDWYPGGVGAASVAAPAAAPAMEAAARRSIRPCLHRRLQRRHLWDDLPTATSPSGPNNGSHDLGGRGHPAQHDLRGPARGKRRPVQFLRPARHDRIRCAPWCGPCRQLAGEAQYLQDEFGEQGFQMIEVLIENASGGQASQADMQTWASDYGMTTVPVFEIRRTSLALHGAGLGDFDHRPHRARNGGPLGRRSRARRPRGSDPRAAGARGYPAARRHPPTYPAGPSPRP